MRSNATRPVVVSRVSATHGSVNMIFHILVAVFFFGFALLLGILGVMRRLYAFSIFQPPLLSSDSGAQQIWYRLEMAEPCSEPMTRFSDHFLAWEINRPGRHRRLLSCGFKP